MKRVLSILLIILVLPAPQASALAPAGLSSSPEPRFQIDRDQLEILSNTGTVWELRERRTGDLWFFEFARPVPLFVEKSPVVSVPVPLKAGLRFPPDKGKEVDHWIKLASAEKKFQIQEWKILIFKNASNPAAKPFDLSGDFSVISRVDRALFERYLVGEEKMFQVNAGAFLEGDGVWGVPVQERRNGRLKYLFIYRTLFSLPLIQEGKLPVPDEVGYFRETAAGKHEWISHPFTRLENLDERMAVDRKAWRELKRPSQRRRLVRHLIKLEEVDRAWRRKISRLDEPKIERVQLMAELPEIFGRDTGDGKERRSWVEKRAGKNIWKAIDERRKRWRRKSDLALLMAEEKIRGTLYNLLDLVPNNLQRELTQFELQEMKDEQQRNGALLVRNPYGDEIGYHILGNDQSPLPPIVVFSEQSDPAQDPLVRQFQSAPSGLKLLEKYRVIVIHLPGLPYRAGKRDRYSLETARNPGDRNYWSRTAVAFRYILAVEGAKSAYVAGSGIGGFAAQKAAQLYRKTMAFPDGTVVENPIRGIILYQSEIVNPTLGPDYEFAEEWPLLNSAPVVGEWLRRAWNFSWNDTLPGRLPRIARGYLGVGSAYARLFGSYLKGKSREEVLARLNAITAPFVLSRQELVRRLRVLSDLPVLAFLPTHSAVTKHFRRAVPKAQIFPAVSEKPEIQLELIARFLDPLPAVVPSDAVVAASL